MDICPTCGQERKDLAFEEKVREILGPSLELYDFGTGVRIMPICGGSGGWLTSSVIYIHDSKPRDDGKIRFLGFIIDPQVREMDVRSAIIEVLPEAVRQFEGHAKSIKEGESLPPPVQQEKINATD